MYGFGKSEEIVGKALASGGLRQRVSIATKVGLDWANGEPFRNATRKRIFAEIDASLKRLRTDVIDIYQVHWPDPITPLSETADAMGSLLKQGKIRAIGVSNFSPEQMNEFGLVAPIHAAHLLRPFRAPDRKGFGLPVLRTRAPSRFWHTAQSATDCLAAG